MYSSLVKIYQKLINKQEPDNQELNEFKETVEQIVNKKSLSKSVIISEQEMYYNFTPLKDISNKQQQQKEQQIVINRCGKALIKYLQTHQYEGLIKGIDNLKIELDYESEQILQTLEYLL